MISSLSSERLANDYGDESGSFKDKHSFKEVQPLLGI